jgi:hypothetical protein
MKDHCKALKREAKLIEADPNHALKFAWAELLLYLSHCHMRDYNPIG